MTGVQVYMLDAPLRAQPIPRGKSLPCLIMGMVQEGGSINTQPLSMEMKGS